MKDDLHETGGVVIRRCVQWNANSPCYALWTNARAYFHFTAPQLEALRAQLAELLDQDAQ